MIIIYTDRDLGALSGMDFDSVQLWCVSEELRYEQWADDVYFWRSKKNDQSQVKALKRRNAPLVVPAWITNLMDVDR